MRKFLEKIIAAKEKRAAELRELIKKSQSADEVRSLGDTLQSVLDELNAAKEQLANLDDDNGGEGGEGGEGRNTGSEGEGGEGRGLNPMHDFQQRGSFQMQQNNDADPTNSTEYRTAFMNYVMRGTPIPAEMRADENTTTGDVGSVIPTVLVNRIIERMDEVGTILGLVTKTSYAAGVEIPTSATKPVATWTGKAGSNSGEGIGSDKQKKTTAKITFTYFKLRCEVSVSMEVSTMALAAFEAKIVENIADAMVKAIEAAIVSGTGIGEPTGILVGTPEENIDVAAADGLTYELLCNAEAAVPEAYEASAKWCMSKKTFFAFQSMSDDAGHPIARINYGISGKPEYMLLGREVIVSANLPGYASAEAGAKFAFIYNFSDYILNTIYDLGIQKKQDWDTEDMLTKAVMSVDGKSTDNASLVTLTKA